MGTKPDFRGWHCGPPDSRRSPDTWFSGGEDAQKYRKGRAGQVLRTGAVFATAISEAWSSGIQREKNYTYPSRKDVVEALERELGEFTDASKKHVMAVLATQTAQFKVLDRTDKELKERDPSAQKIAASFRSSVHHALEKILAEIAEQQGTVFADGPASLRGLLDREWCSVTEIRQHLIGKPSASDVTTAKSSCNDEDLVKKAADAFSDPLVKCVYIGGPYSSGKSKFATALTEHLNPSFTVTKILFSEFRFRPEGAFFRALFRKITKQDEAPSGGTNIICRSLIQELEKLGGRHVIYVDGLHTGSSNNVSMHYIRSENFLAGLARLTVADADVRLILEGNVPNLDAVWHAGQIHSVETSNEVPWRKNRLSLKLTQENATAKKDEMRWEELIQGKRLTDDQSYYLRCVYGVLKTNRTFIARIREGLESETIGETIDEILASHPSYGPRFLLSLRVIACIQDPTRRSTLAKILTSYERQSSGNSGIVDDEEIKEFVSTLYEICEKGLLRDLVTIAKESSTLR